MVRIRALAVSGAFIVPWPSSSGPTSIPAIHRRFARTPTDCETRSDGLHNEAVVLDRPEQVEGADQADHLLLVGDDDVVDAVLLVIRAATCASLYAGTV